MPITMQRSRTLVEEWLVAAVDGKKPDDEVVDVRFVEPGQAVEVRYAGEGGSGRHLRAMFAGEEPVLESGRTEDLLARGTPAEMRVHSARFLMAAPSVIYEWSGIIRPGQPYQPLVDVVFLCATDKQIAEAVARLPALRAERARAVAEIKAKTRPLRRFERGPSEARP